MNNLKTFFENNAWFNIISFLIGVVLSLYLYKRAKRDKKPFYSKKTLMIILRSMSPKKLEIRYDNKITDKVSLTKFAFWNAGRDTIYGTDIAAKDPLEIKSSPKITIYEVEVIY